MHSGSLEGTKEVNIPENRLHEIVQNILRAEPNRSNPKWQIDDNKYNHKIYNFLACDWFKNVLFSTNSLAELLSDSLLLDSFLLDSLLSDSLISQSYSKM